MNAADSELKAALIVASKRDYLELMAEILEDVTVNLNAGYIDGLMARVVEIDQGRLPIDVLCNKRRRCDSQDVTIVNFYKSCSLLVLSLSGRLGYWSILKKKRCTPNYRRYGREQGPQVGAYGCPTSFGGMQVPNRIITTNTMELKCSCDL